MLISLALVQALFVVAATATTATPTTNNRLAGGIIKDKNITFTKHSNPIVVTKDIIIKKDSKLTIEAGTELIFEKKRGIIVHGALEVLGKPNDKVRFSLLKSQQSATVNFRSQHGDSLEKQQVRLVDGELPNEGRVQIKFSNRWHSLCTNSRNLTAADIKILCQEVGYRDGAWYRWFPKRNDTTFQIMTKSFDCSGNELAISQCKKWNRIRVGGGLCDSHSNIGIRCSRALALDQPTARSNEYWRGIEFVNSETIQEYVLGGQSKQKISKSKLAHLVITGAGVNEVGNATAAIRVFGQPPIMNDIEVKDSIYGIMIEDVDDAVDMRNIKIHNNLGYPLFMNTSWGKITMDNLHIENNNGDAIRVVRHEKFLVGSHNFCKFANLGLSQVFPVILTHEQTFFTVGQECCQEFLSNNQLTVHFPVLRSTPNNLLPESDSNRLVSIPSGVTIGKDAHLVIFDDYRDEYPFRLKIQNNTRAQSIVSKSGRLKICYEPAYFRTVMFTLQVVTDVDDEWTGRSRDLEISNSYINQNEGRGIWVDNQRSGIKIVNTTITNSNYLSGLHTENGTGEVIIQGSNISNNVGHGILINLAGGYYHVDNSTIGGNTLKGINIDYDKRQDLVAFNHTFHIGYSLIANNGENGLFIGNVCRSDAYWNISMNSFVRNEEDAILFQTCIPTIETTLRFRNTMSRININQSPSNLQELFITHNSFLANKRKAVCIVPINFVKLYVRHNLFRDHLVAALHIAGNKGQIQNRMEDLINAPTSVRVASNRFYSNSGRYVANIGVEEDNPKQSLVFTKNFLEDNRISEPYNDLKPRSRVSAVVVVTSSNAKVLRNRFDNPASTFEIGSHLEAHSKVINATTNFWGSKLDAVAIYNRIFDRKNRYNLAQIEFLQYLLSPEDLEYATDLSFDRERDKISTFRNGLRLGGEVKGLEELSADVYTVENDIFVRPGGHLIVKPGATLKFHDGVGLMVQGRLDAIGKDNSQIVFTSSVQVKTISVTATSTPSTNAALREFEDLNQPSSHIASQLKHSVVSREVRLPLTSNIRLSHTTMGRLEVQIDSMWGSVCDYGFDIDDAAVACQQLGMIVNKEDWLLEKFQYTPNEDQQVSMITNSALMTNLRCDPAIDTDITKCKAELSTRKDFDGICSAEVGIRCFAPSWSGLRLGMGAETSTLEHITIQKAGMYDYATYSLKPALQIDFNKHLMSSLIVRSNSDSGLGIMFNDVIGRHFSDLSVAESKFSNNERHGIELRSRGITFKSCSMNSNRQNGLDYSPIFEKYELDDLLSWLYASKRAEHLTMLVPPLKSKTFTISSSEDSYRFFVIQKSSQLNTLDTFTISTDPGHMLSIQLLSPIQPGSTEDLNMTLGLNPDSPVWNFRINMTSFPMVSPGYKFHFNYSSGTKPLGNIVLYIRSRYNNRDLKLLTRYIPQYLVMHKFDQTAVNINSKLINSITITSSNITKNGIGLKFRHSNSFFSRDGVYHPRYSNESTNITNNIFDNNYFSSIFVSVDELEPVAEENNLTIPASEIFYNLSGNKIRRNKDGIRQHIRDIRYSNNVFHWSISETNFELNKGGGVNILLPYYWQYDANMSHTIEIYNNSFSKNNQYELSIEGHYTLLNMSHNTFKENRCRRNLISIAGMEKRMVISGNVIEYNTCGQIIEINMNSHADKLGAVPGSFEYNLLRYNRKPNFNTTSVIYRYPKLLNRLHPHSSDYALNLGGVQSLNLTRNIFLNPELRFELLVSVMMDAAEGTINAVENYWGSTIYADIQDKIFDFDDWNNYATVDISPILTQDSLTSASMNLEQVINPLLRDTRYLGGRLTKTLTLIYRKEPYIVESDLTVMPNVKLNIERGVTIEFLPNVGILVLGDLVAAGTFDKPILMRPFLSEQEMITIKPRHLYNSKSKPYITQSNLDDPLSLEHNYAFKHYKLAFPVNLGSVRLCKNEICNDGNHIYDNNIEDQYLRQEVLRSSNNTWRMDGFLEIFNTTTLQWVPICDSLFTEYNAKVVCRQLGYSHMSLFKRGRRMTIEHEQITSIKNWPPSIRCTGDETNLANCLLAVHSNDNHTTQCTQFGNQHTYIYCEDYQENYGNPNRAHTFAMMNEYANFWGGIRFSCPPLASAAQHSPDIYNYNMQAANLSKSRLVHVILDRAGMSHMKRSPALQILQCNVQAEYVTITNSAHHGLKVVTSQANQNFHQLRIRDSSGVGFYYVSLTGSSSSSRVIPYLPLKHIDISDSIFGMINICGVDKEISIEDRALIFFKYDGLPADCVKIVSSKLKIKHLGIRILQFNLFNSTSYSSMPDSVRIYDGNIFDRDSRLIVDLGVTERHRVEKPEFKFHQTTDNTMTVRLHVSGASSYYGFIAEVVTTPISYALQRDNFSNLTFSELSSNKLGAISIFNAGESSPNIIIKNNRLENNCLHLFGNFTSCANPIYMELQNCPLLKMYNNLFRNNQGGVTIKSYSHTAIAALDATIEKNVFEGNMNTNTLALLGPKTDPYQTVKVMRNFFTRNNAPYLSNIVLSRIVANFSYNIISSNIGKHQIEVIGFDKLPLSYQTFTGNWIYNNTATFERDRSTIFGNSAGQQYAMNYLVNRDNHFEISTMNWSRYDTKAFHIPKDDEIIHLASGDGSSKDFIRKAVDAIPVKIVDTKQVDHLYHATINAKGNWWGFSTARSIQGRIRDRMQHEELIKVDFLPYLETNSSLLSGICAGGWQRVSGACLFYVGTRMTYLEAKEFCDQELSTLPLLRGNHYEFSDFIRSQDRDYDPRVDRIWIRSFDVSRDSCPALNDYRTRNYDCLEKHAFICEKDPLVIVSLLHWHRETGGLVAMTLALITASLTFCCIICWTYKSRQRHKEKLDRKSTIHATLRSNRAPYSSANPLIECLTTTRV